MQLHLVPAVDQEPSLLDEAGTDSHALAADPATPPRALRAPPCPGSAAHSSPEREERLMLQEEIMHQTALILVSARRQRARPLPRS